MKEKLVFSGMSIEKMVKDKIQKKGEKQIPKSSIHSVERKQTNAHVCDLTCAILSLQVSAPVDIGKCAI